MPENPCSKLPGNDEIDARSVQNAYEHTLKQLAKSGYSCAEPCVAAFDVKAGGHDTISFNILDVYLYMLSSFATVYIVDACA
jgi:hypothetical protein